MLARLAARGPSLVLWPIPPSTPRRPRARTTLTHTRTRTHSLARALTHRVSLLLFDQSKRPNETVYLRPRDAVRFGAWSNAECMNEECVEASTQVDVVVDLVAFKALLDSRLPLVFAGARVADAALPWPGVE